MRGFAIVAGVTLALSLSGCAKKSTDVTSSYVSPLSYQNYTCQQLGGEAQRVSSRVSQLSGAQDQKASSDAVATGVAIIVFWPAAFLVGGNDQVTAELGQLKGQFDAIEQVSIQKSCGFQMRQQQAPLQQAAKPAPSATYTQQ